MKKFFAFIALGVLFSESTLMPTNQIEGVNNIVHYGENNKISGKDNSVIGYDNTINGQRNAAVGLANELKGENNLVAGVGNSISGKGNFVGGNGNIVLGADASEQDKALMNQKMMEMFASRGLAGIPGLNGAGNQASNNAKEKSPVFSGSNNYKNQNLQSQILETKSNPQPQSIPNQKSQNLKKPANMLPEPVVQKKEEKVQPETKLQGPAKAQQAKKLDPTSTKYDNNLADKQKSTGDDDIKFFDNKKTKTKQSSANQQKPSAKFDSNPVNAVIGQPQQTQPDSKAVKPVQVITEKTQSNLNLQFVQPQPEPKKVEPVKNEEKIVQALKPDQVVHENHQQTLPAVAKQNQAEAHSTHVHVQQMKAEKLEAKEESGFKFYVNDGSKEDSSPSNQSKNRSRYSRSARTANSEAVVVQVPLRENLRQEETAKIVEKEALKSTESSNVKGNEPSLNVPKQSQVITKPPMVLNAKRNVADSIQAPKTQNNRVKFSQASLIQQNPSPTISSSSNNRYKKENEPLNITAVVVPNKPSSSEKPKTAKDVAAYYLSNSNANVIVVTGDQSLNGASNSVINKQLTQKN